MKTLRQMYPVGVQFVQFAFGFLQSGDEHFEHFCTTFTAQSASIFSAVGIELSMVCVRFCRFVAQQIRNRVTDFLNVAFVLFH